jgi:1-phosphofructokinase family hexose kinase
MDVIYKIKEFVSGTTYVDTSVTQIFAGKGLNVARVVKMLGGEVCVTGTMPASSHDSVCKFLESLKIAHSFMQTDGVLRINSTILETSTNTTSHINSESSALSYEIQDSFIEFHKKQIQAGDVWCFSGSIPKGFGSDVYYKMIKNCSDNSVVSILDTRNDFMKFGIRARPTIVKPNLIELEEFFGEQIRGVHHIAFKGKRLIDMGITYVFISLGADGMIALHENDCLLCSVPVRKVVDTVGCGDALVAGLLVAKEKKVSFSDMCRLAMACGISKSMHEGPGLINPEEVLKLTDEVQIEAV